MDDVLSPDELETTAETATPPTPTSPARGSRRIFKISGDTIVEDASMRSLSLDQVKQRLAQMGYPEAANATTSTSTSTGGDEVISFLPAPGRKG